MLKCQIDRGVISKGLTLMKPLLKLTKYHKAQVVLPTNGSCAFLKQDVKIISLNDHDLDTP